MYVHPRKESGCNRAVLTWRPRCDNAVLLVLTEVVRSVGCDLDQWDRLSARGGLVDPDSKLLRPDTKLPTHPHNPTGALPSLDEFSGIIAMCRQAGVWIFADEMYRGLESQGTPCCQTPWMSTRKRASLLVSSKPYGLLVSASAGWHPRMRMSCIDEFVEGLLLYMSTRARRSWSHRIGQQRPIQRAHRERLTAGLKVSREFCEQHDKYLDGVSQRRHILLPEA